MKNLARCIVIILTAGTVRIGNSFNICTAPPLSAVITTSGQAVEGQSYTLTCAVRGDELLASTSKRFQWDRVGGMEGISREPDGTLTFNPLSPSDAGEYMCTSSFLSPYVTGTQIVRRRVEVTVLSLIRNLQATMSTATTITITWTVSGPVDRYDIAYNYTIQRCSAVQGAHRRDNISGGPTRSHTLRGLNEDSIYSITVRANSSAGSTMATVTAATNTSGMYYIAPSTIEHQDLLHPRWEYFTTPKAK
jgi:hypothetical protein